MPLIAPLERVHAPAARVSPLPRERTTGRETADDAGGQVRQALADELLSGSHRFLSSVA